MPTNGTYRDVMSSRGGRNSASSFAGNFTIKILAVDPSYVLPPEFYEYDRYVDRVYIGSHFGFQFQLDFEMLLKGSAIPPNIGLWEWKFVCNVRILYPDGYVKTGQINLGSELVNPLVTQYKDVSFPVTFSSNTIFNSLKYVDYLEVADSLWPHTTKLTLYELIPNLLAYNRQITSVTVTGLNTGTVTETAHRITTEPGTDYQFTIDTKLHSSGATANIQSLSLSPLTINQLALPDYNYFHLIDSNNYFHQTTAVDAKVQGTDNIFGEPQYKYIEANTLVTLERNVDVECNIHAWQDSYPDDLTVKSVISGGPFSTIDYYTASGGFVSFSKSWKKYSFSSNISGATNSLSYDNLPDSSAIFQTTIDLPSLIANGDTTYNFRLPFRGWWQPGADIYHVKNTVIAGTGNTREYNYPTPPIYMSSYRYLDITGGSATTTPQNGKLLIYAQSRTDFRQLIFEKDLVWNPGSQTQTIDTCFAGIAHTLFTDISSQDNPYPRPTANGQAGRRYVNDDLYGIGWVNKIECTGNVNISEFKLTRYDNTGKASLIGAMVDPSATGFSSSAWIVPGTSTFLTRRFFEQDVSGKNEEEYDVLYSGGTYTPVPITQFCNNIQNRTDYLGGKVHRGWIATATGPTTGDLSGTNLGWYNPGSCYSTWLNGMGLQAIAGNKTYSILRDLSQEYGDRDIYSQIVFDRINARYPPDYFDAFQVESPGSTSLKLIAFNCQRGAAHGLVQEQQYNQLVSLGSTTGTPYGDATTDILGSYQTGLPYGNEGPAVVTWLTNNYTIPTLFTAKRTRVAFYGIPVPAGVNILSADISGFYQQCIGTVNSGNVELIFTDTTDFSTFDTLTTNITGMLNVAIAWLEPTYTNQMVLITQRSSDSAILRYTMDDFVNGVASMATVIGNGTTPAIAINNNGTQIIFWRTSSSNVQRIIIDAQGNVSTAASNVVVGNVSDSGLGCYWRDDVPYLVYNHTTNGLTVVKSDNYGNSFS